MFMRLAHRLRLASGSRLRRGAHPRPASIRPPRVDPRVDPWTVEPEVDGRPPKPAARDLVSGAADASARLRKALVVVIVAALALGYDGAAGVAKVQPTASPHRAVPFLRGVTVVEWGPTAYAPGPTAALFRRIATRSHVDTVTLPIVWMQHDAKSTTMQPGSETAKLKWYIQAIRSARAAHLRVLVRPYIDLVVTTGGAWRGSISPSSLSAWFSSYRSFILRFASLAQAHGATGFVVGSELRSMQGYSNAWRSLVTAVRQRFKGFVTYQANWGNGYQYVTWWDALDAIDISAYFPLTAEDTYSVADLVNGWRTYSGPVGKHDWFAEIQAVHDTWHLPVIFGEIGYRPGAGSARAPWDSQTAETYDPAAQTIAYKAALTVWYHVPWFRGMNWWAMSVQPPSPPHSDTNYEPVAGSMRALAAWYATAR